MLCSYFLSLNIEYFESGLDMSNLNDNKPNSYDDSPLSYNKSNQSGKTLPVENDEIQIVVTNPSMNSIFFSNWQKNQHSTFRSVIYQFNVFLCIAHFSNNIIIAKVLLYIFRAPTMPFFWKKSRTKLAFTGSNQCHQGLSWTTPEVI